MKKALFFAMGLVSITALAQIGNVGINNDNPKATLHLEIASVNKSNNTNQGIIVPKMSKNRVAEITTPVEGTLVYVVDENTIDYPDSEISAYTGTNEKVKDITTKGYYYYDGEFWVRGVAPEKYYRGVNTGNVNTTWITPGGVLSIESDETIRYVGEGNIIYAIQGANKLPDQQNHTMDDSMNIANELNRHINYELYLRDCHPVDIGYHVVYGENNKPRAIAGFILGRISNLNYGAEIPAHNSLLRCHMVFDRNVYTVLTKVNLSWFKKTDTTIDFTDDNILFRPQNMP